MVDVIYTANHGRGNPLHDVGAVAEHYRDKARKNDAHSHDLGTDTLDSAEYDGLFQIGRLDHSLPVIY